MARDTESSNAAQLGSSLPRTEPHWVEVAVGVVFRSSGGAVEFLIARRHAEAIRGGLWEFPGGKIEPGELPAKAALREVEEEVGIGASGIAAPPVPLVVVEQVDPELVREKRIRLHAFLVAVGGEVGGEVCAAAEAEPSGSREVRWVSIEALDRFEWPKANVAIIAAIRERFPHRPEWG